MSDTTRLKLPLIAAQQAQKHVTHNEALLKLDVLVQASVLDKDLNTPPASPAEGDAYIVAASATGDWAGQEGNIAVWQNGGWVFHVPSEGWKVWAADEDVLCIHDGTNWIPFEGSGGGISLNPVPDGKLGINTTADNTNRLAVKSDAVLFSHDDVSGSGSGDVRFKVNKAAATNTASLLFQTNWSGRAELGTSGSDDFTLKTSADGTAWSTALSASSASGSVDFPSGLTRAGNVVWDDANVGTRISSLPENTAPASTLQVVLSDGTRAQLGNLPTSGGTGSGINSLNPADGGQVGINTTADATNRLAVKSDAMLFSHDDVSGAGSGDVQFKINKAAATNTASLLFQTNWSGRTELGLAGNDDFQVKVSADGNAWRVALQVAGATGNVGVGKAPDANGMLDVGGAICCGRQTGAFGTGGSSYTAFVLGQPGEGGALYAVSRADPTKSPFTGLCGWDNGSVMNLYFGGGNWGVPDATNLYFYTAPSYSDTPNTGLARLLINSNGDTLPVIDNAYALGNAGQRWRDIFSANPVTTTSDARLKKDISDCSLGLEFIRRLRPVSFRWKEGRLVPVRGESARSARAAQEPGAHQPETVVMPGRRRHFGLLAQQVHETLRELGEEDFAGWLLEDRNDENSRQGLRYAEFIAPMIRAIQELADEVDALKASCGEGEAEDGHAGE